MNRLDLGVQTMYIAESFECDLAPRVGQSSPQGTPSSLLCWQHLML